jgi:predicted amidohydrolase YtcJ
MSFDLHTLMGNSRALALAGISFDTLSTPGGVIQRDSEGNATGLLLESASALVRSRFPEPTPSESHDYVRGALRDLANLGYTEVHDMLSDARLGPMLARLADEGDLPLRVGLYVPLDEVEDATKSAPVWERLGQVRLLGGKIFTDGTLNSRTAWMLHEYADPIPGMPRGTPLLSPDAIASAVTRCRSLGLGLAMHAIGDGAVRACLDGVELARRAAGTGNTPHRSPDWTRGGSEIRIEHCELIDERDVSRFARLGVTASVQPCHLLADIEALERFVPARLSRVLPLRELIDAGCAPGTGLVFGSDTPVVGADPRDSIQAAVRRGRACDTRAIGREQAIGEDEAWRAFSPGI